MRLNWIVIVASLGLAACTQSPTHAALPVPKETAVTPQDEEAAKRARMNYQPVAWPLKFKQHNFGVRCYDTQFCSVWYAGMENGSKKPQPSSATRGPDYLATWNGNYTVDNFPPPAEVTWRSKDGTEHRAEIDIGEIFRDELVRHSVPREEIREVPDGKLGTNPNILLEINDRTIRVYMRARVPTRYLRKPDNPYSDFRDDLILVKTTTY